MVTMSILHTRNMKLSRNRSPNKSMAVVLSRSVTGILEGFNTASPAFHYFSTVYHDGGGLSLFFAVICEKC
jgi:hypothetical protein